MYVSVNAPKFKSEKRYFHTQKTSSCVFGDLWVCWTPSCLCEVLGSTFQPRSHCRSVASLCLLKMCHQWVRPSSSYKGCLSVKPDFLLLLTHTLLLILTGKTRSGSKSFIPRTASLWNSLSAAFFPPPYNL